MTLTTRARKQAGNWLAMIHATGKLPCGMHCGSAFATTVLLGYTFDIHTSRFIVKPDALSLVSGHPLVATVEALKGQGFRVNTSYISRLRRWTLTKGVPMVHTQDMRTVTVDLDGSARQLDGPEGRWEYKPLGNPGKEREKMKRTDAEIKEQIDGLRAIAAKPTFRKRTFFGDSNVDAIEAQIETLERRFSVDTVDSRHDPDDEDGSEWTEHVASSARDAAYWLAGDSDDKPVDGWEGLH